ncbi:PglL family O-oligosaccharyltransferase [Vibrio sonorensis]|uniref:PglL family O-oligosaccharyltransferase n=1 Tax=Vibrio sonorensis TaxID=1004316 RepID=UPI0008D9B693|nr:PglL family O-oligosaccharyltransferase [Vibrio sonorensis]
MATVHVSGTQLAPKAPRVPLTRSLLVAIAFTYLIAMHVFMPNPGGAGLSLAFNATTWSAISLVLGIGLYQMGTQGQIHYNKLTIGLFISCLLMTVPALFPNALLDYSAPRLTGLWAGFLLFVVLQQFPFSNKQKQRLLWFVLLAVALQAIYGWVQFLILQPDNWFGYNTDVNRPYGIFQQPNVMASFLGTGLVLSGYLLTRHPVKYRHVTSVLTLYCMPLLTVPLLVIISSRTGWLGATLATVLLTPYIIRFSNKRRLFRWIALVFVGLGLGIGVVSTGIGGSDLLFAKKAHLESPRSYTYPQTLDMIIEKPFTGYGYGRFEPEYLVYTARQHQLNENYKPGLPSLDHPHNELFYWTVEGGILPLLAILLAVILVLSRLYQAKKGTRLAMFSLFLPIFIHSQLEYPFYHSAIHWISFIILLYWVDQRASSYRVASFSKISQTLFRSTSLLLPILTCVYMATVLHSNYLLTQFERNPTQNVDRLNEVSNPIAWQDRLNWDIYSSYLNLGLIKGDPSLIQPFIDWAHTLIPLKPRPALYTNLILAYQEIGDDVRAEQIRSEAEFLFPQLDFSNIEYVAPTVGALQASAGYDTPLESDD